MNNNDKWEYWISQRLLEIDSRHIIRWVCQIFWFKWKLYQWNGKCPGTGGNPCPFNYAINKHGQLSGNYLESAHYVRKGPDQGAISWLVQRTTWDSLIDFLIELYRCRPLCGSCHNAETSKEREGDYQPDRMVHPLNISVDETHYIRGLCMSRSSEIKGRMLSVANDVREERKRRAEEKAEKNRETKRRNVEEQRKRQTEEEECEVEIEKENTNPLIEPTNSLPVNELSTLRKRQTLGLRRRNCT